MNPSFQQSLCGQTRLWHKLNRFLAVIALSLLAMGATARAGMNLTRMNPAFPGKKGTGSGSPSATSQTATAATIATSQAAQAADSAQRAQVSLQRSLLSFQAQMNAQNAAHNLSLTTMSTPSLTVQPSLPLLQATQPQLKAPSATRNLPLTATSTPSTTVQPSLPLLPATQPLLKALSATSNLPLTATSTPSITAQASLPSLQAIKAQPNAQSTASNLPLTTTSTTVQDGLSGVPGSISGLVPGVAGTDPSNPKTIATTIPTTVNTNGTASVTLAVNSAITLPPNATGNSQITVSGTGTVGSITTGGTITVLKAGVATTVAPGSTISLTNGGTVTFAGGSAAVPSTFSTYTYTTPSGTSPVPTSWSGVGGLTQSTYAPAAGQTSGPTTVTITQTQQQALLTWQTFNIGQNTTLDFDQSAGGANVANWVAINKVAANIAPSQVLGAIQAPGQVYVINQNGIIFGGSSQVNTGALVAASLPINNNLVSQGLLNNPDLQFLFSQLNLPAGTQGPTPAFTPAPAPTSGTIVTQDSNGNEETIAANSNGQDGDVVVQQGAQLSSPTTPEHVGGRVALIGPNVNNSGTISTPDGQTILAAGLQVGFAPHPSDDPSLRGLDVSIGAVSAPSYDNGATGVSGTATNDGLIEIPRADLTIAGEYVNQNAVVDSSTSVSLNGRIDLLADYDAVPLINGENGFQGTSNFYPTASGVVTLGANSLTQILPELSSTDTIVGTQLALSSLVNIHGGSIYMGTNALLLAPSANLPSDTSTPALGVDGVALTAGVTLDAGNWLEPSNTGYFLAYTGGQVYLDSGSTIDVSGSENVSASVSENIISAQLLGTELANFPLQQDGALRGATVDVNIQDLGNYDGTEWVGTPLADISGYVNLIQRSVGELTTAGGTVAINAGGSTVLQPTSTIDVSGGWINYQGGMVQTTEVVSNGQIINISQATPNLVYNGIYTGFTTTSAKWGVTQTYSNPFESGDQYVAGYVQGGNGGGISITSPAMVLDGKLLGNTVAGPYQSTPASQLTTEFTSTSASPDYASTTVLPTMLGILAVPTSSSLSLTFQAGGPANEAIPVSSPTPPNIIFQSNSSLPTVGTFGSALPAQRLTEVDLSPDLLNVDGFGNLNITNSDGDITVPANVSLTTPYGGSVQPNGTLISGGSITFQAANIDIEGSVTAPGGSLSFTAYDLSPYSTPSATPPPDPTRGKFTLGASASLNTAGLVVDALLTSPGAEPVPMVTSGGSVTIDAYNVDLVSGSQDRDAINVSGGVYFSGAGKFAFGNGGSINIEAGQDPLLPSILGGQLVWNPELTQLIGYSGSKGGSLTVKAPLIQIGGSALLNGDTTASGNTLWLDQTDANGNLLEPDFFSQGGFTSYTLNGIGEALLDSSGNPTGQYLPATLIASNTTITPVAQNWVVSSLHGNVIDLTTELLPSGDRTPVSLAFNDAGAKDPFLSTLLVRGDFVMDAGSVIQTDPQTNSSVGVSINANTVTVLGSIIAPGGTISIKGASNSLSLFSNSEAVPTVDLGPDSLLSTAGAINLVPNAFGYLEGSVLNGGTISVDGNIVAEAGAVLNVSGTSGVLDVPPSEVGGSSTNLSFGPAVVATHVNSNGGSIILTGEQELFTDATLLGGAGGPTAQGGSLTVSSGIYPTASQTPLDPTLVVTQNALTIPVPSYYPSGQTAIGNPVVDVNGNVLAQNGYFAANSFNSGGFSSLTLGGTVQFHGSVTITANQSLTVAQGGVIFADSTVNLNAPYIDLGMAFQSPLPAAQQTNIFQSGGAAFYFSPTYGSGDLNVTASLIDIGNLSLQNIGNVSLTAANGDIRGDGTLDLAGAISLTAGQIYPTTDNSFTIAAYDYNGISGNGSVTIAASGTRQLPYSAGGELNIYASNIIQGGVLRAPIGTINLGSGVTGSTPIDLITGSGLAGQTPTDVIPTTQSLTLSAGSVTSVSAVDPTTGKALDLPYGTNSNGVTWTNPAGSDITVAGNGTGGIPDKTINISGVSVDDQSGATIDISGGGDLYSWSFVAGTGGTNDILASSSSFAIIPGYQAAYAPYYSSSDYTNGQLAVGEQVYLNANNGLAAGVYTLLPARYALEPGAFLITPQSGTPPLSTVALPDGSSIVSGYEFNGLNSGRTGQPLLSSFEVDPPAVVAAKASYDVLSANTFLGQSATAAGLSVPRLPVDAGQLVLAANQTLSIEGAVDSQPGTDGLGGLVDIATTSNILISGPNTNVSADESGLTGPTLVLDSSGLSAFGADSLLIGGFRQAATGGDSVTVTTSSLMVDNAGASVSVGGQTLVGLSAPDIILVSNQTLTLAPNAEIEQSATTSASPLPTLFLNGDGSFLRVSSNLLAETVRTDVNPLDTAPSMVIGTGVTISGANGADAGSVTLDSTYATSLSSSAILNATSVNLDSGQISIELTPLVSAPSTAGLVLSGLALSNLQSTAQTLSLLSYSSIDIYGSGEIGGPAVAGVYPVANLALHAAEIRGFSDSGGGGTVVINAKDVSLNNSPNGMAPGAVASSGGSLTINSATIDLGTSQLNIDQYSNVSMNASSSIILDAETKVTQADTSVVNGMGAVIASNNLTLNTPLITAGSFSTTQAPANETITATGGNLVINTLGTSTPSVTEGLGATLTLVGQNVTANSTIVLPGGNLTLHATSGNVSVGGMLSVAGTAQVFNDLIEYTSGGQITLTSSAGSVSLASGSVVDISANSGGRNAGSLSVNASQGTFTFADGTMTGQPGTGGQGGDFSLDVGTLSGGNLQSLDTALDAGGLTQSITIRDETDANVTVDGTVSAGIYNLSVDQGSITVNGTINASNVAATDPSGNSILVGGMINLTASRNVTLASGSVLTVEGTNFNNAGEGGSVTLAAGAETNGVAGPGYVNIGSGSTINLTVDANNDTADGGNSAALGHLTGTLVISAPQTAGNTDLQVAPINGTIVNASSIVVEGYKVYTPVGGLIDSVEGSAATSTANDGTVYGDAEGFTSNTATILSRLLTGTPNASQASLFQLTPGAEIINTTGDLTLQNNWDLSTFRFGPSVVAGVGGSGVPGILTLRAAGNIVFDFGASLSDGFDPTQNVSSSDPLWTASLLPVGDRSWSYQIVAGADFSGANFNDVQSSTSLQASGLGGSVLVGQGAPTLPTTLSKSQNNRSYVLSTLGFFQTIRTGTGDITINAGGDVELLNSLATIYTAGTQAPALSNFTLPVTANIPSANQPVYGAQYSLDGGNVTISAQGNIAHYAASGAADSSLELPTSWLYRQGSVNTNGQFVKSTSWWIDFSNFFEGVGALGGGNVTLNAGGSVINVDAVVPTNERTTDQTTLTNGTTSTLAADQTEVELGGGDLVVHAGDNIDGGVYYVERGQGTLAAGNQILTNDTRAAVLLGASASNPSTWLPTTLFLGDGSFDVTAGGDVLLGPVANPFLLPQDASNGHSSKSYFSTYATSDAVNVSSLTGAVTLQDNADGGAGSLANWYGDLYLVQNGHSSIASTAEPWLDSAETTFGPFTTVAALMPSTLDAVAFSSDVDVVGSLTLSPSPNGTIDLVAAGSLNGFQINSEDATTQSWGSSEINLSDANPASVPSVISPLSSQTPTTTTGVLNNVNNLFAESGATEGVVLQTKEALHADINGNVLHANDPNPVHLFAQTGDISGFTLFSGKAAQVVAGQDITDIALYIQNVSISDVSVVAAGRDIIAYDPESPLRLDAAAPGNAYIGQTTEDLIGSGLGAPNAGDIQISGPGTLEVLAGRNLNLGVGPNNPNGTAAGISSIGNTLDPYLTTFTGADIIAGAGMGGSAGFDDSLLNFGNVGFVNGDVTANDPATFGASFIGQFLSPTLGGAESALYLPQLGMLMGLPSSDSDAQIWTAFSQLPAQNQDTLALDIFYLALRDAGRNHNSGSGSGYASGYAAIKALFPGSSWPYQGDISLTSREIKTTNGGNINLLAPGGQLTVGYDIAGNQPVDQGILTEDGGNISIFTNGNVNVGTSRIFTLHGGNEIIWSTNGDIAAGNSSKTVQSAPPTRVLIDPQSGAVQTDLAGLATGGGIGVLETVVGAAPSDVDLIAPNGTVNAGDAGIRVSGNLNIAALRVLNAGNIQVGGKSAGVPTTTAPNIAGLTAASSAAGSATSAADQAANQARDQATQQQPQDLPSIITVEVIGYGGDESDD